MNEEIAQIRRETCERERCSVLLSLNFNDPCERCPNGHWGAYSIQECREDTNKIGLGDKIASVTTPIARALGSGCIDKETKQLKPDSGCGKMKTRLNAGMSIAEAIKLRIQGK